jgi:integrase
MPLSETTVRMAKPRPKTYRLTDGHGLYVEVAPSGSRYWRLKYRFGDKEKRLAIGVYPVVTLAKAREEALEARRLLHGGIDPGEAKRQKARGVKLAAANSFESVAREWQKFMKSRWTPHHARNVIESLEQDIFPALGHRPIAEMKAPEFLDAIRKIERRGALDIAQRVRQRCGAVFAYAIGVGCAETNPVTAMKGIFATHRKTPRKMLPKDELPAFLTKLENFEGERTIALALRFILLTMVRTSELRGARWDEIDFAKSLWSIPAARMKMREPHVVPLSRRALAVLDELKPYSGPYELLFPGRIDRSKPISENTMLYAIYRMGYHHRATTHGFRALASTILNECGLWRADAIERQLAHREQNAVRAAYHRADYIEERTRMVQWWADFLDGEAARAGGQSDRAAGLGAAG